MTLPVGVATCTLTFGSSLTFEGEDVAMDVIVTPTHSITWAATGQPVVNFPIPKSAVAGMPGQVIVPITDQDGFVDSSGNDFVGWAYLVQITWRSADRQFKTQTKSVQPITGQTNIDLDLVPAGSITTPVSAPIPDVISVNGQTGVVSIATGGVDEPTVNDLIETYLEDHEIGALADGIITNAKVDAAAAITLSKTADSTASTGRLAMTNAERSKLGGIPADAQSASQVDGRADARIDARITGSPAAYDTFLEIANAMAADDTVATALAATVATKAPLASPAFTGTPTGITKGHVGLSAVDNAQQLPLVIARPEIRATALNTWPTLVSRVPTGYTGPVVWDHTEFGTVTTLPAELAGGRANDFVRDIAP